MDGDLFNSTITTHDWCYKPSQGLRPSQCYQIVQFIDIGQVLKPLATINFPKSLTFLGNFGEGVKIYHFPSEINFGQLL